MFAKVFLLAPIELDVTTFDVTTGATEEVTGITEQPTEEAAEETTVVVLAAVLADDDDDG